MTLSKAIEEAFGRTEYVRRAVWPTGSVGVIDCLSENPSEPFSCTMGRAQYISKHPMHGDPAASDWYPCNIDGKQATSSWQAALSAKDGATGCIGRGDQCEVWLDGCALAGGGKLTWVKPHELSLLVSSRAIGSPPGRTREW